MNKKEWKEKKEQLERNIEVREYTIKINKEGIDRDKFHLKEHNSMEKYTTEE